MSEQEGPTGLQEPLGSTDTGRAPDQPGNGVRIGDVEGGIHRATIAGRDVVETTIDELVYNVFGDEAVFQEQHGRADMLALMQRVWITHVLEPSLSDVTRLTPVYEVRPDAVLSAWEMVIDTSEQKRVMLPVGTTVVDLFVEMEGSLLLLGDQGVGKTTALLELARQVIAWAEQDPAQPIPVVLDFEWWTGRRRQFSVWLMDLLCSTYHTKPQVARAWVENDELSLLLDGLDKVKPQKRRERCVQAINDFREEHGLMPIVVCCRSAAYETLKTRLQLQGAVCLQRLESPEHRVD